MSTHTSPSSDNNNNTTTGDEEPYDYNDDYYSARLLKRHYSTIGIGDVFLQPPPPEYLPSNYLRNGNSRQQQTSFLSWEMIGTIKATPQDFIVREIAEPNRIIPGLSPEAMQAFQVANLTDDDDEVDASEPSIERNVAVVKHPMITTDSGYVALDQQVVTNDTGRDGDDDRVCKIDNDTIPQQNDSDGVGRPAKPPTTELLSPRESLQKVLELVYPDMDGSSTINAASIFVSLGQLEEQALNRIRTLSQHGQKSEHETKSSIADTKTTDPPRICLPMISSTTSVVPASNPHDNFKSKGGDRGEFHRALRAAFPLLKSEVVHSSGANEENKSHIQISVEDTLDGVIPFLYQPEVDLLRLFQLRHRGYNAQDRPRHDVTNGGQVALRLLPSLARERRREVHALLERLCPEFTRNTDPNYPLPEATTDDVLPEQPSEQQQTAAILLWWSKRAQQQSIRKRKRQTESSNDSGNDKSATTTGEKITSASPHTLCVMKKVQTEHLTAINHLKMAVRCTPSDIGLAGIKDMLAVTYQFCTFRHITPHRLARANSRLLQHGVQLGRFHPVDWQLNQGDLNGNRFDITVRGLQRVRVSNNVTAGGEEEELVPCDRQHVMNMVHRIQTHGFINFYGDQRVGLPGTFEEVGVRSFDIGRAMLQRNFTKAIDLLMTGRAMCNESHAARQARDIWRKSGGDVASTLKAMPHAIARERVVLQGLKRYGKDNPLAALKCLHFGVRAFWVNAYQSYIWNKMATKRIELFGTSVIPGDLYYIGDDRDAEVEVVTEGAADSVPLSRVVLPLPGYNIRYPENQIGEEYRKLLASEGVSFDRDAPPEATAKGGYRRLIEAVEQMIVSFEDDDDNSERVKTMKLTFDLKRGSYATSMLRELMLTTVSRDGVKNNDN